MRENVGMRDSDDNKPKTRKYPLPQPGEEPQQDHGIGRDGVSYIAENITMHGDIEGTGDLVVRGMVEGGVQCGTLVIEEGGSVRGDIRTDRLRLMGTVEGAIYSDEVAIEETAMVSGDIEYSRMRMSTGSAINGQLNYRGERAEQMKKPDRKPLTNKSDKVVSGVFEDPSFSRNLGNDTA